MRFTSLLMLTTTLVLLTIFPVQAQTGSISGQILLNGERPVNLAQVTYLHIDTGIEFITLANTAGEYSFDDLLIVLDAVAETRKDIKPLVDLYVTNSTGSSHHIVLVDKAPVEQVTVFNILGQKIISVPLTSFLHSSGIWISSGIWDGVSSCGILISDGVYFASAETSGGLKTKRVIHQKSGIPASRISFDAFVTPDDKPNQSSNPKYDARDIFEETDYLVTISPDFRGDPFLQRTFTRTIHDGDNGFVTDTVYNEGFNQFRVLFLGNSYTAYNGGIATHLAELVLDADPEAEIFFQQITFGGYTLQDHFNTESTIDTIENGDWDYVILQEQSTRPIDDPDLMFQYATLLDSVITGAGAETGFFMTWAREYDPEMIDSLAASYEQIGTELGALIVPVGLAWDNALTADPGIVLHATDGSHPNPAGTYLTICTFFASLYGNSPEGLEYVNDESVTNDLRGFLQSIAWETVDGYDPGVQLMLRVDDTLRNREGYSSLR